MTGLELLIVQIVIREGIPFVLQQIDKAVNGLPSDDPTKAEWAVLKAKIRTPFDTVVPEANRDINFNPYSGNPYGSNPYSP